VKIANKLAFFSSLANHFALNIFMLSDVGNLIEPTRKPGKIIDFSPRDKIITSIICLLWLNCH
jgi:hypothetical protein